MLTLSSLQTHCFTFCVLIVAVRISGISFCKRHFKYHASTQTCMLLVNQSSTDVVSKNYCTNYYKGGPKGDIPGHLVYIYNEDTDNFVKDLLPNDQARARIGLSYLRDGSKWIYRWGESTEPANYFGWERSTPIPDHSSSVVISKSGWKQLASQTGAYFICQVDADIKLPNLTCPVLLLGKESPEIKCVLDKEGLSITRSKFRDKSTLAQCFTSSCNARDGYKASITDDGESLSMTLSIMPGNKIDMGLLHCDWKIHGYTETLSTSCNLTIYEVPENPPELIKLPNQMNYNEGEIITISCTVNGGYPLVSMTMLTCDTEIKDTKTRFSNVSVNGNKALMEVNLTEGMNGKSCICSARHVSNLYASTNMLKLSVKAQMKVKAMDFTGITTYENVSVADPDREVKITCLSSGTPMPQLFLYHTNNQHLLNMTEERHLVHTIKTSCNVSGTYICIAFNTQTTEQHKIEKNLKIRCKPTHCKTDVKIPQYGVVLNTNATIQMCVYAYPKPLKSYLYKDYNSKKSSFQFNYTDESLTRGLISLSINDIKQSDLGNLTLYFESFSSGLHFALVEQGPPSCPKHIRAKEIFSDMITLEWKPGHDGGLRQTFIIIRHGVTIEVVRLEDTKTDLMEYNVTGLSDMTSYKISIDVENEKGRTNCSNVAVNVTTNATSSAKRIESDLNPSSYIPVVILLVLVASGVLIVIVVRRRKRKHQDIKKMLLLEEVNTRPPKLEESNTEKEEGKSLHSSIYNNSTLDTSEPKNKIKAIVRKPKRDSSKSKPSSGDDVNGKGDCSMEGETYAQELKVNKRKDNDETTENIYNNQLEMVNLNGRKPSSRDNQSAGDWSKNMTNGAGDDHIVYANTTAVSSPDRSETKTSPESNMSQAEDKTSARTLSPEGLVYVSVEINSTTKNPVIQEQKETKQPQHEQVVYMSIDHLATSEVNLMVDEREEE